MHMRVPEHCLTMDATRPANQSISQSVSQPASQPASQAYPVRRRILTGQTSSAWPERSGSYRPHPRTAPCACASKCAVDALAHASQTDRQSLNESISPAASCCIASLPFHATRRYATRPAGPRTNLRMSTSSKSMGYLFVFVWMGIDVMCRC